MEYEIHNIDELAHHGIKGQRWGIRRYQNKDGSLTPAGQKRRAKLEGELDKLGGSSKKGSGDSDGAETKPAVKKTAGNMSDDELARAISRARMEDEYRRLRPEPKPPEKNAFAKQMLNDVIKPAAINSGRKLAQDAMDSLVKKITGEKVDPNSLEVLKKTYEKMDYKQKIDKMLNPDKYLSEEDKNKRQQRDFEAETREAQREGYQSVTDRAKAKREAADAQAKADAEAKKIRDEFISRAATDANIYRQSPWEKRAWDIQDEVVGMGKSIVNERMNQRYSELPDPSDMFDLFDDLE